MFTMSLITTTNALAKACKVLAKNDYLTIDTEFLRERTYYPKLCLVQLAGPGIDPVAVDPLAKGIDLKPLYDLMADKSVIKVFHAARQDLEIFYNLTGTIPTPLFDTQVAAMVCGYGEQVGYGPLVQDICNVQIDKGAQFTDWSRRPLSDRQLSYALSDVTHLRDVYTHLVSQLEKQKRKEWVLEEMEVLTNPDTYRNPPEDAWQRIKIRTNKPRVLAILKEVAAWREAEAQRRDIPRGRVFRDETLADIAIHPPKSPKDLEKIRSMPKDIAHGKHGQAILKAVDKGLSIKSVPVVENKKRLPQEMGPTLEMLKMLLRIQSSEHGVAAKLIANSDDLQEIAMDDKANVMALKGWRRKVFGDEALLLKSGKLALGIKKNKIHKIKL